MKRWMIYICLFLILSIGLTSYSYSADYDREDALAYINNMRHNLGIQPLENNSKLEQSADFHSKYMAVNDSFSPIEENGNKYYRGRYSWDRASYFYYSKPYIMEFIHDKLESIYAGTKDLIDNPYSRVTFLDPLYEHIGLGNYKEMYTFDLGGESRNIAGEKILAVYPYDGMIDVPISWQNNYKIDPYRGLEEIDESVGVPITVTYYSNSNKIKTMSTSDVILINTLTDKSVKTKVILPQDDKYLTNTLIILPLESLEYDTSYKLELEVIYAFRANKKIDKDDDIVIQFTTEKKNMPLTRGSFVEQLVKDLDYKIEDSKKTYKDVDSQTEEAKYIYTAYERNLVKGYGDNTFRADVHVTREQVYAVLIRALEMRLGTDKIKVNSKTYEKWYASKWAIDYIHKAHAVGLIKSDAKVDLKEEITQKEYKELITEFLKIYHQYGAIPRFMY